jgi:hypothetical protein
MLKLRCVLLHLTPQPILANPDLRLSFAPPLHTQGPNWSKFRLCRNQPLLEIRRHRVGRFDLIVQILWEGKTRPNTRNCSKISETNTSPSAERRSWRSSESRFAGGGSNAQHASKMPRTESLCVISAEKNWLEGKTRASA